MNEKEELTQRQMNVLPFLLVHSTVEAAAKAAGISSKQIHEWMHIPVFKQALEDRKNAALEHAVDRLKMLTSKAVNTLVELLDTSESEMIRHRVAVDVLNMNLKYMEFKDIEQRIKKLEESITT